VIVEVAQGSTLERELRREATDEGLEVVIVGLAPDAEGQLPVPDTGQVVLSVPSPEALVRQADVISRVVDGAGDEVEPLVVVVEQAEELREEELRPLIDASRRTRRDVILRVIHASDG
jgi:hypothetical protein